MRLTNLTTRPVVLSDGTVLAAAGTDGASKEVKELSDRDRARLVHRGAVHVTDESQVPSSKSQVEERGSSPTVREGSEEKLDLPPLASTARKKAPEKEIVK
jgi:hypothetical protein